MKAFKNMWIIIGFSLLFIMNYVHSNSLINSDNNSDSLKIKSDNNLNLVKLKIISKDELLKMNSAIESKGKWDVANRFGYLGKYQIGKLTLLDLGYDSIWVNSIQSSIYLKLDTIVRNEDTIIRKFYRFDLSLFPPKKQTEVIRNFLTKNENVYLKHHIAKYVGKEIDGVRITKAGILSASFLGIGYVDKFLKSDGKINPSDGNGHSVKDRMKHFQNYELK